MKGTIFDIQNYAIYDGPGIRTAVYFKGCPLKCYWCHNPESQKLKPEMAYWAERCARCGKCVETCPARALRLVNEKIVRDDRLCTACGECARACPDNAMEKIGFEINPEEIIERVARDKIFYEKSGGGVTITGGEPAFQKDFLLEVLKLLKNSGIHTAIETCGCFSTDLVGPLAGAVDLFLYDLKHINSERHREATGADNKIILKNFSDIMALVGDERIIPRIPLVPDFNTDSESVKDLVSYLEDTDYNGQVHLLPYHGWAKGKYERIGRGDTFRNTGEIGEPEVERIMREFSKAGFKPLLHG